MNNTHTVYFLIEIVDEIILSSAGLIATHYFDWTISQVRRRSFGFQFSFRCRRPFLPSCTTASLGAGSQ